MKCKFRGGSVKLTVVCKKPLQHKFNKPDIILFKFLQAVCFVVNASHSKPPMQRPRGDTGER